MHPRWLGSWPSSNMSSEFSTGSTQIVNDCWTLHVASYDDGKISGRVFRVYFTFLHTVDVTFFYVILETKVIIFLLF